MARLRSDFTAPNVDRIADVTLEDHLDTLLTELAISLTTIEQAAGQASAGLRDGSAIQKVLSQRHGAQRASLGWREEDVSREVRALQSAIEAALQSALSEGCGCRSRTGACGPRESARLRGAPQPRRMANAHAPGRKAQNPRERSATEGSVSRQLLAELPTFYRMYFRRSSSSEMP